MPSPASQRAEESVIGAILREPSVTPEVVGTLLEPEHFYFAPYRVVFDEIVERHYADDPIDALTVAEAVSKRAAGLWKLDEREAVDRIVQLSATPVGDSSTIVDHANVVKKHADLRSLLLLSDRIRQAVEKEEQDPDQIAGAVSADAMRIATDQIVRHETFAYGELGRRWVQRAQQAIAARQAGIELGAYFGMSAIDHFTKGLRPTELLICGGEPGVGKSAVWWRAAQNFAQRQMQNPEERRVGVLVMSLEMGEDPSSTRLAQMVGGVDSDKLREGTLTREELHATAKKWADKKDIPLYANHASSLRCSQLRAIVAEEIRRHNVGVVIVDHFRQVRPDMALPPNEADDEVVRFLKEGLAKDLNLAVVCLAHVTKAMERPDKRPRMADLRGSGMISAFADFVSFVYRPWKYATDKQREHGQVGELDAEMIWDKARHSGEGIGEFYMNLAQMQIR